MTKDYQDLLEQLVAGKIAELVIEQKEFMEFQPILMNFNQRKNIVGSAKRGGGIIYHYSRGGIKS